MSIHDRTGAVRRGPGATLGALLVAAAAAGALAAVLSLRVAGVLRVHTGLWRVDAAVEVGVTAVGVLVALWLAASALLAAVCIVVRVAGTTWRAGERLVQRCASEHRAQGARGRRRGERGARHGLRGVGGRPRARAVGVVRGHGRCRRPRLGGDDAGTRRDGRARDRGPGTPSRRSQPSGRGRSRRSRVDGVRASGGAGRAGLDRGDLRRSAPASTGTVVVAVGDSLWAIAARHLPPGATDAEIAAVWPQWYRANAATIGADPNLITPGQVLAVPSTLAGASS